MVLCCPQAAIPVLTPETSPLQLPTMYVVCMGGAAPGEGSSSGPWSSSAPRVSNMPYYLKIASASFRKSYILLDNLHDGDSLSGSALHASSIDYALSL